MLERKVLSFIKSHSLLAPGDNVIVGVSGGPDSVCLLHLLNRLKTKTAIHLHVAHLNHQLRGREAEDEANYVRKLATDLRLPCTIEARDVRVYREVHGLSEEEAAREVRYAFLAEIANRLGGAKVAVGHTADDQVETILMHLIRGTGLAGLQGMAASSNLRLPRLVKNVTVVRPLLAVYRQETEAFCKSNALAPHFDATNYSRLYFRNRIRADLVPLLQSYNPTVKTAILRLAALSRDDVRYIDDQVTALWPALTTVEDGLVIFDKDGLATLPANLQRHLLRRGAETLLGDLTDIEAVHIEAMRKAIGKPVGAMISLPRKLVFQVGYDACSISLGCVEPSLWPAIAGEYSLQIPGKSCVAGWSVETRLLDREAASGHCPSPWHAHLDPIAIGQTLSIRGRRPGERFQPLGMGETKKLQDFMVDAKIPRRQRDSIPLLVSPSQIVWVVGWRLDERAKVQEATEKVLCVTFEPQAREGN
ncbi:MAG: tRNA lysidine(34) synthetase TilS [Dehalococcoidia bacterium]|nr:tRNA lysidine(34) synthetase TilS [Dehalococcoidia bacterium]